ncbi:hypothetical protein HanPI659440_Chr14g0556211 [Helianthus annuus]|nr:hypothetical protein HanPI659440_Chr14g0556211 [Helianthus annuus]
MEERMKEVNMGNSKLLVNVARFAAENKEEHRLTGTLQKQSQGVYDGSRGDRKFQANRTFIPNPLGTAYRDSLVGSSRGDKQEEKVVEVSSYVKPLGEWFEKSLIVRTTNLMTLFKLDKLILKVNGPKISFKYVGGLYMLLVFESSGEIIFFKDYNPYIKVWFSWLEVWKGQSLPFERIKWLKITGILLHLLDNEVFDSVGRVFSKVVHASLLNKEDKDYTFDLIGVLVGDGERICDSITLKWNDRKFKVWVSEELGDWVPDSINDCGELMDKVEKDIEQGEDCEGVSSSSPEATGRSPENSLRSPEVQSLEASLSTLFQEFR